MRNKRSLLIGAVTTIPCIALVVSVAYSGQRDGNELYAETPTTLTHETGDRITLRGSVNGPTFAAREDDPGCTPGVVFGSTCRRLCGDLPPGRTFDSVVSQDINPPNYARFNGQETYEDRNPVRVCFRVKNWGQITTKNFTVTFRHKAKAGTDISSFGVRAPGDFVYNYAATNTRMNWRRTNSGWIEDATPGSSFPPITFRETGKTNVDGNSGTIVRAGDREMDVFIPDVGANGTRSDWLRQRHGGTNWQWVLLGQIVVVR